MEHTTEGAGPARCGRLATMTKAGPRVADDALVQLAIRVPKALYRRVRIHCVDAERMVRDFVAQALAEKLKRDADRGSR